MLYRAFRRFTFAKAIVGHELFYLPSYREKTEFHGSSYGGWAILEDSLDKDAVVFSFGLGEDTSFDESILGKYECRLFGFDPTPKAIKWVESHLEHPKFTFVPSALSTSDKPLRLFFPSDTIADQVSASAVAPEKMQGSYFDAPANTLGYFLQSSCEGKCDLLKMDIEGMEYEVIAQAIDNQWLSGVNQLLVEFHHWMSSIGANATRQAIASLKQAGFKIVWISRTNHEYLFVR